MIDDVDSSIFRRESLPPLPTTVLSGGSCGNGGVAAAVRAPVAASLGFTPEFGGSIQ